MTFTKNEGGHKKLSHEDKDRIKDINDPIKMLYS